MSKKTLNKLIGQYCKIVIKEPGNKKTSVMFGYLKDVDYKKNFVVLESSDGLGMINKNSIVAIKPSQQKKT